LEGASAACLAPPPGPGSAADAAAADAAAAQAPHHFPPAGRAASQPASLTTSPAPHPLRHRWQEGDLNTASAISYPDRLLAFVQREFAVLKRRQAQLLGLKDVRSKL
jgi:hypothetical protein